MKNQITLKITSHEYACSCPFTSECQLSCDGKKMCKGTIDPGDLNGILGYGADWNCEIPVSDLTALLLVSYFEIVSDEDTSTESADIWEGFHLKTRITCGYKALKSRAKTKIPTRLRKFGQSVCMEDAAIDDAWKAAKRSKV